MKEKILNFIDEHEIDLHKLKKANWKRIAIIAAAAIVAAAAVFYAIPKKVNFVINEAGIKTSKAYETRALTVGGFLEEIGVTLDEDNDRLSCETDDIVWFNMDVTITKSFDITITVDGTTTAYTVLPASVERILKKEKVSLGEYDVVTPAVTDTIDMPTDIVVQRGKVEVITVTESIPYESTERNDSSVTIGDVEVVQTGEAGSQDIDYQILYLDGVETSRTAIKTVVTKEPVANITGIGTNISMGGAPSGYSTKYSMRAVSYFMSGNPHGSYGMACSYGTVAVDPSVIPLGTRLYIEGYGYAIANDIGGAIKGNVIDLYMERYDQCLLWGSRYANVYVLS